MQHTCIVGFAKGMITRLSLAVLAVFQNQQRFIEENLLSFGLVNIMFFRVFTRIAFVPVKACYLRPVDHLCILSEYTLLSTSTNHGIEQDAQKPRALMPNVMDGTLGGRTK
ncbi:hypothetical protein A7E75_04425 [Syntrophotalea acetylenica]|uniref:Uncharacterized protein n=1 Tax=Syntrophotalea acetylenica TaxID=29542 RepID=A0A1L3GEH7_SYNAC|nr:hypothetical protein A7E75_04425 [Syntrophotalea acetylenica]APG44945.1 hypothetical protein A6070_13060 [Syntrophotalea acetylenica]